MTPSARNLIWASICACVAWAPVLLRVSPEVQLLAPRPAITSGVALAAVAAPSTTAARPSLKQFLSIMDVPFVIGVWWEVALQEPGHAHPRTTNPIQINDL